MNKHFNKNLIMSEREKHLFQQSNSCWICKKLIDNINFQLTKKVPVIFHNLRGYNSHLIFNELTSLM